MCNWICPKCKKSNHSGCDMQMVTAMYFQPHYVDGVNVNPDRNTRSSEILCYNCKRIYSHSTNGETETTTFLRKYKEPKIVKMDIINGLNLISVDRVLSNK